MHCNSLNGLLQHPTKLKTDGRRLLLSILYYTMDTTLLQCSSGEQLPHRISIEMYYTCSTNSQQQKLTEATILCVAILASTTRTVKLPSTDSGTKQLPYNVSTVRTTRDIVLTSLWWRRTCAPTSPSCEFVRTCSSMAATADEALA